MCGEKCCRFQQLADLQGSPPRVRGKENTAYGCMNLSGITPACAGKSMAYLPLIRILEDHPRVCGEKELTIHAPKVVQGSPPRVRGKVCALSALRLKERITPACAGKSCSASWTVNLRQRITPACAGKSTEVFQN